MKITSPFAFFIRVIEIILALLMVAGVVATAVSNIQMFLTRNWNTPGTFYDLVYLMLLLMIGVELAKMLVVRDMAAVLELLAFVAARKMLKPDLGALDVFLVVAAFVALMWARRHLLLPNKDKIEDESSSLGVFERDF